MITSIKTKKKIDREKDERNGIFLLLGHHRIELNWNEIKHGTMENDTHTHTDKTGAWCLLCNRFECFCSAEKCIAWIFWASASAFHDMEFHFFHCTPPSLATLCSLLLLLQRLCCILLRCIRKIETSTPSERCMRFGTKAQKFEQRVSWSVCCFCARLLKVLGMGSVWVGLCCVYLTVCTFVWASSSCFWTKWENLTN